MIKIMRSKAIEVNLGVNMIIEVDTVRLDDYDFYGLIIGTAFPPYVGTENVSLLINGEFYPLVDRAANLVVAGKLRDGRLDECCNILPAKYRLQFGANGMPSAIPHFVVLDGLCPMKYNGPAGANDNL